MLLIYNRDGKGGEGGAPGVGEEGLRKGGKGKMEDWGPQPKHHISEKKSEQIGEG